MRMPMMIMLDNGRGLWSPVGIRHRREVHISLKKSYGLTGGDYRDYFDNDFLMIIIMKFSGHIVYYDFYGDFAEIDCEISFKCILGVFDFASSPFYCKCDFIHV